jgi:TatD DNase family protein
MEYELFDTHCHLEMDEYEDDRDDVVERAEAAGVRYIINAGSDMEANLKALSLSGRYSTLYPSVGIHPHDADTLNEATRTRLEELLEDHRIVAIGEIGLDYHYMNSPRETQIEAFKLQIGLAKRHNLPIIIHSRKAKDDTLSILKDEATGMRGVLHCFSGDIEMAKKAMDMGFYISIAGPVTFKNANRLREIVSLIPDDYLLIETDAPYLSPVPMRGRRNEPSFLRYIAEMIAQIRGVTLDDIARITTLNAKRLFRIGELPDEGEVAYRIRNNLYLNITNRCTNRCGFCVRFQTDYVKGHNLRLKREPTLKEIISAIDDPASYKEVVFCGLGEPLLRLDVVKEVARWVKDRGGRVRINTNGHGNMINQRNILPELCGIIDSISISLDAEDRDKYERICRPVFKDAFDGVISFIKEAKRYIPDVNITVVDIPEIDIERCKALARELGVGLRVRRFNVVG